ncbi:MAG: Fic family protein [Pseudoramibacter sp.]
MRFFDYTQLSEQKWDSEILSYVAQIHEYKGRQALYLHQQPVVLKRLIEIAKIQSTESSNEIEGIVTTNARIRELVDDKTTPRNRDEKEILGYRNVLNLIHENYENIPLSANVILQLHRDLLQYTALSYGGAFKNVANEIDLTLPDGTKKRLFKPLQPYETPKAVEAICQSYNAARGAEAVDDLILIPCFILDFLCIHPFNDGNGRMSRLLTLLLLYQSGYVVGQYVSIEKAIADTKTAYYQALQASDQGWHDAQNDPTPFIKYTLGILLKCYRDFESRLHLTSESGAKSTAYDVVKQFVQSRLGPFTKQDVLIGCPSVGKSSAENALKKLAGEGVIAKHGAGRATYYTLL